MSNFLSNLPKTTDKSKKRVGRGYGSGKGGHTVGRGQKGQKSRSKVGLLFTGTKNKKSLIQRMPVLKGKNKFKPLTLKPLVLSLKDLEVFKTKELVDEKSLLAKGLVKEKELRRRGVKVLSNGRISKALKVKLLVSKGARKKIEDAGGEVLELSAA